MQTAIIIVGILFSLFLLLLLVAIGVGLFVFYKALSRLHQATEELRRQNDLMTQAMQDLATKTSLKDLPSLVEGLMRLCTEMLAQFKSTESRISEMNRLMGSPDSESSMGGSEANPLQASEEAEIEDLVRNGISRTGAAARVREKNLWKEFGLKP